MQRLTYKDGRGQWALLFNGQEITGQIADRLAAYEDSGMEPEAFELSGPIMAAALNIAADFNPDMLLGRLKEIICAASEGRLVDLPCRIGDKVWCIRSFKGVPIPKYGKVDRMEFIDGMKLLVYVKYVGTGIFGEKIFHTREEALQAIRTKKGKTICGNEY